MNISLTMFQAFIFIFLFRFFFCLLQCQKIIQSLLKKKKKVSKLSSCIVSSTEKTLTFNISNWISYHRLTKWQQWDSFLSVMSLQALVQTTKKKGACKASSKRNGELNSDKSHWVPYLQDLNVNVASHSWSVRCLKARFVHVVSGLMRAWDHSFF